MKKIRIHGQRLTLKEYSNLSGKNLNGADLRNINLSKSNFSFADLSNANLSKCYLEGANFYFANLSNADLSYSNLSSCNFTKTCLIGANLTGAMLPSPTMMLLARWKDLSDKLTIQAIRFDAANHPDPSTFDRWAESTWAESTYECPYSNFLIERACHFFERPDLWRKGPAPSAYKLMKMILKEKCIWSETP